MRIAAGIACMGFTNEQLDELVSLYELVIEKEGGTSLRDVSQIEVECEKRAEEKRKSTFRDKVDEKVKESKK